MGRLKQQMIAEQEKQEDTHALLEEAHKQKKIGMRQYGALKRHAASHSPDHIAAMIKHMEHLNFRDAHKAAMQEMGV